jgi:hypothetical protein
VDVKQGRLRRGYLRPASLTARGDALRLTMLVSIAAMSVRRALRFVRIA